MAVSYLKNRKDKLLNSIIKLPAAGKTVVTGGFEVPKLGPGIELYFSAQSASSLQNGTRKITYTIEESDDNHTWTTSTLFKGWEQTGASATARLSKTLYYRLSRSNKKYIRAKAVATAGNGAPAGDMILSVLY